MDSWIFRIARKVCILAFAGNIFIHAIVGASASNGIVKGTISMLVMLVLLVIMSKEDLKRRVGQSRKKRNSKAKEVAENE